jgi:hypothetical protein
MRVITLSFVGGNATSMSLWDGRRQTRAPRRYPVVSVHEPRSRSSPDLPDLPTAFTSRQAVEKRTQHFSAQIPRRVQVDRMPQCGKRADVYVMTTDIQTSASTELIVVGEELGDVVEEFERQDGLVLRW